MAKGKRGNRCWLGDGKGQCGWLKQAMVIVADNERVVFWLHEDDVNGTAI